MHAAERRLDKPGGRLLHLAEAAHLRIGYGAAAAGYRGSKSGFPSGHCILSRRQRRKLDPSLIFAPRCGRHRKWRAQTRVVVAVNFVRAPMNEKRPQILGSQHDPRASLAPSRSRPRGWVCGVPATEPLGVSAPTPVMESLS
jgi:hypothetical protein